MQVRLWKRKNDNLFIVGQILFLIECFATHPNLFDFVNERWCSGCVAVTQLIERHERTLWNDVFDLCLRCFDLYVYVVFVYTY